MLLFVHGAAGGLDELAVGVVAFAVLWFAVKLAGRKPAGEDDAEHKEEATPAEVGAAADEEQTEPAPASSTKFG
jgi:hypothetical protein